MMEKKKEKKIVKLNNGVKNIMACNFRFCFYLLPILNGKIVAKKCQKLMNNIHVNINLTNRNNNNNEINIPKREVKEKRMSNSPHTYFRNIRIQRSFISFLKHFCHIHNSITRPPHSIHSNKHTHTHSLPIRATWQ